MSGYLLALLHADEHEDVVVQHGREASYYSELLRGGAGLGGQMPAQPPPDAEMVPDTLRIFPLEDTQQDARSEHTHEPSHEELSVPAEMDDWGQALAGLLDSDTDSAFGATGCRALFE